ncbi:MAG TPA: putrescine ABC transporter permease PotI, partial [Afipia sp.]|nr:putrescine ABC transporter permease PotI [Afipia sp.]
LIVAAVAVVIVAASLASKLSNEQGKSAAPL